VGCYEDSKLLKLFTDIIRILYDADIVAEDTIMWWAKKGAHPKVRQLPRLEGAVHFNPKLRFPA